MSDNVRNKYNAKKTTIDGIEFDSQREADRYCELRLLEAGGKIRNLELQPKFKMTVWYFLEGVGSWATKETYTADFRYEELLQLGTWLEVVEDCKGFRTREYKHKRRIMAGLGITIRET